MVTEQVSLQCAVTGLYVNPAAHVVQVDFEEQLRQLESWHMRVQVVLSELSLYPSLHVTQLLLEIQYLQFAIEQLKSEHKVPESLGIYPSLQLVHVILSLQNVQCLMLHKLMRHSVG